MESINTEYHCEVTLRTVSVPLDKFYYPNHKYNEPSVSLTVGLHTRQTRDAFNFMASYLRNIRDRWHTLTGFKDVSWRMDQISTEYMM